MKNPDTGKSRGFGFVTFKDVNCVDMVLSTKHHVLDGRQVSHGGRSWMWDGGGS